MKVGERIRVFKILNDGGYIGINYLIGKQRPEIQESGSWDDIPSLYTEDSESHNLCFNINSECRQVCTMVIKSIKNA